jgi:hypothetical protein
LLTLWEPEFPTSSPVGPTVKPSVGVVNPAGASEADCWAMRARAAMAPVTGKKTMLLYLNGLNLLT